jgi:hypothetical protein
MDRQSDGHNPLIAQSFYACLQRMNKIIYNIAEPADHENLHSNESRLVADDVSRRCFAGNEMKSFGAEEAHKTCWLVRNDRRFSTVSLRLITK